MATTGNKPNGDDGIEYTITVDNDDMHVETRVFGDGFGRFTIGQTEVVPFCRTV